MAYLTDELAACKHKENLFFSAKTFAVVGASRDTQKWGNKVFQWFIENHHDVIPVNPYDTTSLHGIPFVKSISDLSDPKTTSISIVTQPEATLSVLQQAKALGIFSIWIQPGAEDDAVVQFIKDSQMEDRVIHCAQSLPGNHGPVVETNGPCGSIVNIINHDDDEGTFLDNSAPIPSLSSSSSSFYHEAVPITALHPLRQPCIIVDGSKSHS